jgi:uncharacterized protein YcbX
MTMRIAAIYRYPIKGFSPERLSRVQLDRGAYFPGDRMFAVENGPSGFDADDPRHLPKISYLMLMRNAALAGLETRYDDASCVLTVSQDGREALRANLGTAEGRQALAAFLPGVLPAAEIRGPIKVLAAPEGYRFTDSRSGFVSIINLASVAALEDSIGRAIDPLRFRGNLHVEGLAPWAEFDLVGQIIEGPSGLRLKVTKRIDRCAATSVEPGTGLRDMPIVKTLMAAYGHVDCGVYAEIVEPGAVAEGHRLTPLAAASPAPLAF